MYLTIDEYRKEGVAISTISLGELYEGVFRNPNPRQKEIGLLDFLEGFRTINITKPVAWLFGEKRARLRESGFTVSDFDLLISCVADCLTVLSLFPLRFAVLPK